ncbi:MAG TPA: rhamnan synthesis F family protein [Kineosporiaceae bacterium]|nr:rhamnan synthesis F family protein [Kineosporiaceae bacterium]
MLTFAVFAHYDPHGQVAPHVLYHLDALATSVNRLIIVSTATLTPGARQDLTRRGELVERGNEGYDFCSWQAGLERLEPWWKADLLLLANDSVVGPLTGYRQILDGIAARGATAWGITATAEAEPHVQSYLLGFSGATLCSPLLRAFWLGMTPAPDRGAAIERYELGLSRMLRIAGMPPQAYFRPTSWDDLVARTRRARAAARRSPGAAAGPSGPLRRRRQAWEAARPFLARGGTYNPMIALWDRALDGRLPFVKIESLRDDPYHLDRHGDRMLSACERAHPAAFFGVREYLQRTRADYERLGRVRRKVYR